jgi:hypothetical protein
MWCLFPYRTDWEAAAKGRYVVDRRGAHFKLRCMVLPLHPNAASTLPVQHHSTTAHFTSLFPRPECSQALYLHTGRAVTAQSRDLNPSPRYLSTPA